MNSTLVEQATIRDAEQADPCRFSKGDFARVKPLHEILETLDENGTREGLPFMPEMVAYCGRRFRVARRVEHVYLDFHYYVARLNDTVVLDDLRCGGGFHDGCQMACPLLWKEAWLQPAEGIEEENEREDVNLVHFAPSLLITEKDEKFFCQATQLVAATTRLPWWQLGQYRRQLAEGDVTPLQFVRMLRLMALNWVRHRLGIGPCGLLRSNQDKTPAESLHLQQGELVEVKGRAEIEATLDAQGKNRGLAFVPEMAFFCGRRFRVARRVDRMIVEGSGQMRDMRNTVALESVTCRGLAQRRCPRGCFHLWREIWLKRATAGADKSNTVRHDVRCF